MCVFFAYFSSVYIIKKLTVINGFIIKGVFIDRYEILAFRLFITYVFNTNTRARAHTHTHTQTNSNCVYICVYPRICYRFVTYFNFNFNFLFVQIVWFCLFKFELFITVCLKNKVYKTSASVFFIFKKEWVYECVWVGDQSSERASEYLLYDTPLGPGFSSSISLTNFFQNLRIT